MIALGLLFLVIGLGAGGLLFMGTSSLTDQVSINVLGGSVGLPPLTIFLAGAVCMLLVWLGWVLMRSGTKRSMRNRRQAKEQASMSSDAGAYSSGSTAVRDEAPYTDRP